MLDFSEDALKAQLVAPGTYACKVLDARPLGHDPVFLALRWQVDLPDRDGSSVIEELICVEVGPGGDAAQAIQGFARLKAIFDAHSIEPRFPDYDTLIAAILGKRMQMVVRHGRKEGLPIAKVAALLPPRTDLDAK